MTTSTLKLDAVTCTGHGLCAQVLPEHVSLDEWGYPIVGKEPIEPALVKHARAAVRDCPARALRLLQRK